MKSKLEFDNTEIAFAAQNNYQLRKNSVLFFLMNKNWLVKLNSIIIRNTINLLPPMVWIVKKTVYGLFCGGVSIADCKTSIEKLGKSNIGTILDYSVEGAEDEMSFDAATSEILNTIDEAKRQNKFIPFAVFKVTGIGSFDILEKAQSSNTKLAIKDEDAFKRIKERVEQLCKKAVENNVRLFFDAEESWIQNTVDALCDTMMEKYNRPEKIIIYNTYQFYRTDTYTRLVNICENARKNGFAIGAKLVRGAYMEKERQRALDLKYPDPIQTTKENTDYAFNSAISYAICNLDILNICLGTHNQESCQKCVELMAIRDIPANDIRVWFAQLLGMSDNITFNLADAGFNVAKYVPYGPVKLVMPYLLRRAEENTSIAGQSSREYELYKREKERRKIF